MIEFNCTRCDLSFPTVRKREDHLRNIHQSTVTVIYTCANGDTLRVGIERNESGLFQCIRCLKDLSIRTIHRHSSKCMINESEIDSDDGSIQLDSPTMMSSPLVSVSTENYSVYCHDLPVMKSYEIFLIKDFGILFCKICKFCIYPKQVETHLRENHGKRITKEIKQSIKTELQDYESEINLPDLYETNALFSYIYPNQEEKTAVPLLPVFEDGLMCPVCQTPAYFSRQQERMLLHFINVHRNPALISVPCLLQQIYKHIPSKGRRYFRIQNRIQMFTTQQILLPNG